MARSTMYLQYSSMALYEKRVSNVALLISGPKQLSNDIDVYLQLLLEDLSKLLKDGLKVFYAYLQEYFILRAIIFCTVNDFSTLGNMLGFNIKGAKTYPICAENTCSLRKKIYIYLSS
jgi:Transposase family tnp2